MRKTLWIIWKCGNCGETLRLPSEHGSPSDWGCSCNETTGKHAWYKYDTEVEESW